MYALASIVNYYSFIVLATVIMIASYDCKTFIVQATEQFFKINNLVIKMFLVFNLSANY
jgi:hypothetical protein